MEYVEIREFEVISLRGGDNREEILSKRVGKLIQYFHNHVLVCTNSLLHNDLERVTLTLTENKTKIKNFLGYHVPKTFYSSYIFSQLYPNDVSNKNANFSKLNHFCINHFYNVK